MVERDTNIFTQLTHTHLTVWGEITIVRSSIVENQRPRGIYCFIPPDTQSQGHRCNLQNRNKCVYV